ncbi:glycerol-3-phosphate dehydrogenase [Pseudoroseicyclus aestuarii]|uniref:Glycerol-3-phosphate dehydrogenase n=1 Tax=Pseudoroseicyclus aestuarii TaxID=1795041 RepID=A0A318SV59_9RHOB|nr:glycerol-3-phosphate dehydrogenase [Pseudoroseicyclus aestuarii]PYE84239.1 homodimeric glycerol 3-phosphate dehydrogenase (quinone) [Pseudoroseicyclus aestuarii]
MERTDLLVIGGGINGCGIARDAAGRGLQVVLAEMGDLAGATSSASTKLFHGGLRYLEYFEIRLVREALQERETLLAAMPHISWPMRFVLPLHTEMRFEPKTPASRVIATLMPWTRGRRPAWAIRAGLALYDRLGGGSILPGTRRLDLARDPAGKPLKPGLKTAYEYSDCWVEDARLVALNARDAAQRGATILTRTRVTAAVPHSGGWHVTLRDETTGETRQIAARMLVNAAGPWAAEIVEDTVQQPGRDKLRLVRGSHIVVPRLYDHDRAYFFQGDDGRIVFAIPYEGDYTLIGTTDADHPDPDTPPECTPEEVAYLCDFVSRYFEVPVTPGDVVWTYSGVRPLHAEGEGSATAASRDYVLRLSRNKGAPVLSIFGGKITTYRRLAEGALARVDEALGGVGGPWTARVPLPGGDFPVDGFAREVERRRAATPWLEARQAERLVRAYGTDAVRITGGASGSQDMGEVFGAGLTEREVDWLMEHEFARRAEDVVWRRTKLGLRMSPEEVQRLDDWMLARQAVPARQEQGLTTEGQSA